MGTKGKNNGAVGIVCRICDEKNQQGNTHLVWTQKEETDEHNE